jgi:hypothetical protein
MQIIPFLNQTLTSSNALRRSSPYSLYCFVAARFSPRVHLDLEMELGINKLDYFFLTPFPSP